MKKLGEKGQLSIEGIVSAIVAVILYIVAAAYVFLPIFQTMQPSLENTGGAYGTTASTIILVLIYIIIPMLLIVTAVMYVRPRVEIQQ